MIMSYDSWLGRAPQAGEGRGTGLYWGLATALKPYALIYLPYFILKKRWPAVAGGLAVFGLAVLSPAFFYGLKGNILVLGEWRSTLSASTPRLYTTQDNISLMGFLNKWTGEARPVARPLCRCSRRPGRTRPHPDPLGAKVRAAPSPRVLSAPGPDPPRLAARLGLYDAIGGAGADAHRQPPGQVPAPGPDLPLWRFRRDRLFSLRPHGKGAL